MTAQEQYKEVIQRIDNRINELKEGNAADLQQLELIEQQYEEAVTAFQSDKADELHKELTNIRQNMDNRSRQIAILEREDNPTRKQAAEAYLIDLGARQNESKRKARDLEKKAKKAKEAYLQTIREVVAANREYNNASISHNRTSNSLFGTKLNEYGVTNFINLQQFEIKQVQFLQNQGGTN